MQPEGKYYGELLGAAMVKTAKGSPQMQVKFQITHVWGESEYDSVPLPFERSVFISLTSNALYYAEQKLARLGFNDDFNEIAFKEAGAELRCSHDTYQGEPKERWDIEGEWSGGSANTLNSDEIRKLSAVWKARKPQAAPPKPTGAPQMPPGSPPDDDIPFEVTPVGAPRLRGGPPSAAEMAALDGPPDGGTAMCTESGRQYMGR